MSVFASFPADAVASWADICAMSSFVVLRTMTVEAVEVAFSCFGIALGFAVGADHPVLMLRPGSGTATRALAGCRERNAQTTSSSGSMCMFVLPATFEFIGMTKFDGTRKFVGVYDV